MAISLGNSGAPSSITKFFDALFTQSLANTKKSMTDQIGTSNAFFHELMKGEMYESADGGTHIEEPLMYALTPAESYDNFDVLPTYTTDGVTMAIFEWRNLVVPVAYSMSELRKNQGRGRLINLVETKKTQAKMGIEETFGTQFWQGGGDGFLTTAKVNSNNGSSTFDPIGKMISITPSTGTVGTIDSSVAANSWWRNQFVDFTGITTYDQLLFKMDSLWIACTLGTGGAPNLIVMDPTTYQLFVFAQYSRYRQTTESIPNYPFEATKYKTAKVVMDEKVPDFKNNLTSYATAGSMVMFNTKFFKIRYDKDVNFDPLMGDNGMMFQKPINQDARIGHISWRGTTTISNRRKQGVGSGIPRTLVA